MQNLLPLLKHPNKNNQKNNTTKPPAPVLAAKASAIGTQAIGQVIELNGINSQTYDGVSAQWQWRQKPASSQATIQEAQSLRAKFMVDAAGEYIAQLTLTDSNENTSSADVSIRIQAPTANQLPQASFQLSQASILINQTMELDGTASKDEDGDKLTYLWEVSKAPNSAEFSLQNENSV